jgi:hypothetical protein
MCGPILPPFSCPRRAAEPWLVISNWVKTQQQVVMPKDQFAHEAPLTAHLLDRLRIKTHARRSRLRISTAKAEPMYSRSSAQAPSGRGP